MTKKIIAAFVGFFSVAVFAAPSEIIIVRHADKFAKGTSGPFLSAKGQVRAEKFANYYLAHYSNPDFIFAAKPDTASHPKDSPSYRPLQTLAPLANQLSANEGHAVRVETPYHRLEYPKLAHDLLADKKYNGKLVLVCWQHGRINDLAKKLGVTVPIKKWEGDNYDMVYVLKYDPSGKISVFQILDNQYPVAINPTWQQLAAARIS